jgi:RNA polymerase sigma factor (sigma-70 family)
VLDQNGNIEIIWKNFLSGNKEAFAFLYNNYINSLYRYGTKICKDDSLVKDAIQEVFLDLYMKREKNKTNPENLKYYLILALRRNLIKKLKRNRKMTNEYQINDVLFEPVYSIEQTIIKDEEESKQKKQIIDILNQLPAKKKEALYLRYNDNPFDQRLTALMIGKKITDSSVPMSLLADHPNVQFNYYRGGFGVCETEMH